MRIFFSLLFLFLILVLLPYPALQASEHLCDIAKIGKVLVPCPFGKEIAGPAGRGTFGTLALSIINVAILVVGSVAVAFLIYGGFRYLTAYGNEEHAEAAKRIIRQSILGLIIVILSFATITIITSILIKGTPF